MKKFFLSFICVVLFSLSSFSNDDSNDIVYKCISSLEEIGNNSTCLIVNTANKESLYYQGKDYREAITVRIDNYTITNPGSTIAIIVLEKTEDGFYTMKTTNGNIGYLASNGKAKFLVTQEKPAKVAISFDGQNAEIKFIDFGTNNILRYYSNMEAFACTNSNSEQPIQLYKKVEPEPTQVNVGEFDDVAWTPQTVDLSEYTDINWSEAHYEDFQVTITPNWNNPATQPDNWSENTDMPEWLWNQMTAIQQTGNEADNGRKVDGYYYDSKKTYPINAVEFPCSGLYTISIEAEGYKFNYHDYQDYQEIRVLPNISNTFSYTLNKQNYEADGFSINGVTGLTPSESNYTFAYPAPEDQLYNEENIHNALIFIPGLYLANIYYNRADVGNYAQKETDDRINAKRKESAQSGPDGYDLITNSRIDLSKLKSLVGQDNGTLDLKLVTEKNGAVSEPTIITLSLNKSSEAITTDIATIASDSDNAPVYFTIDGRRIAEPSQGIYIRKTGNKAEKVILTR